MPTLTERWNRSQAATGRRACQIQDEWQLCEVLRQGLQRDRERIAGCGNPINTTKGFRAYRAKEGGPEQDLQWRPMRKGIADLHRRAEVSQKANERLLNALATVDDSRSVEEVTADIQKHTLWRE